MVRKECLSKKESNSTPMAMAFKSTMVPLYSDLNQAQMAISKQSELLSLILWGCLCFALTPILSEDSSPTKKIHWQAILHEGPAHSLDKYSSISQSDSTIYLRCDGHDHDVCHQSQKIQFFLL